MRSNSESLATKCFTEQPTPVDCTPRDVLDGQPRREVRVFGVALEVAAGERMAMDVDGRREQHVRTLAPGLAADPLADRAHELADSTWRRARCRTGTTPTRDPSIARRARRPGRRSP